MKLSVYQIGYESIPEPPDSLPYQSEPELADTLLEEAIATADFNETQHSFNRLMQLGLLSFGSLILTVAIGLSYSKLSSDSPNPLAQTQPSNSPSVSAFDSSTSCTN
jgi:hypothetical protein